MTDVVARAANAAHEMTVMVVTIQVRRARPRTTACNRNCDIAG
jgi:hypothetical protein